MTPIPAADTGGCRYAGTVDLRHLRELVVIAEELNISRASDRLYLSQPAVSAHLSALERYLGVRLFHRTGRGLLPTPEGMRFVAEVRTVLNDLDGAVAAARDAGRRPRSTFVVGFTDNAAGELLGPLLAGFAAAHLELRLRTRELSLAEQLTAVSQGVVHAAIVRPPLQDDRLEIVPFAAEPRMLAIAPGHRLADADALSLADVADEPWIGIAANVPASFRDFWALRDERGGDLPRVDVEAESLASYLLHVQLDQGVAVVGATASRLYASLGLAFVPLRNVALSTMAVAIPRNRPHVGARALAEHARARLSTLLPLAPGSVAVPAAGLGTGGAV